MSHGVRVCGGCSGSAVGDSLGMHDVVGRSSGNCNGAGWPRGAARGGELEEIVNGAEDSPLGLGVGEAAQEKLAKAAGLLDLAEDRLDHLLAQAIAATPGAALEPPG